MTIIEYCISVFITQLVFIGTRTWNVRSVASGNIIGALVSGAIVHIAWLIGISIGVISMNEILSNWNLSYLPVVISSLSGGLLGTYIGMRK